MKRKEPRPYPKNCGPLTRVWEVRKGNVEPRRAVTFRTMPDQSKQEPERRDTK